MREYHRELRRLDGRRVRPLLERLEIGLRARQLLFRREHVGGDRGARLRELLVGDADRPLCGREGDRRRDPPQHREVGRGLAQLELRRSHRGRSGPSEQHDLALGCGRRDASRGQLRRRRRQPARGVGGLLQLQLEPGRLEVAPGLVERNGAGTAVVEHR